MNRIFSLVWNRALRTLQVASELSTRKSGSGASGSGVAVSRRRPLALACAAALGMAAFALPAWSATCPLGAAPIGSATGVAGTTAASGNGTAGGAAAGAPAGSNMCLVAGYFVTGGKGGDAAATGGHGGAGGAGFIGGGFKLAIDGGVGGGAGGAGYGAAGGNGGIGIVGGAFSLINDGYLHGGVGGNGTYANAGAGGAALAIRGADTSNVTNNVMIRGGAGGIGIYGTGGNGGIGIVGSNFIVTNNNALFGGHAGYGFHGDGGNGAAAVAGGNITVVNTAGGIFGGNGGMGYLGNGGAGGDGIDGNGAMVINNAQLGGGAGGNGGLFLHGGGAYGTGGSGGAGGAGVAVSGHSMVLNHGALYGGMGGQSKLDGGAGGAGLSASGNGVVAANYGSIAGGAGGLGGVGGGGGAGGAGIVASGAASLSNHVDATVDGGAGANGGFDAGVLASGTGGNGGAAVTDAALLVGTGGFNLTNDGTLLGGKGGYGVAATAGNGGAGIAGSGFNATNTGSVTGGTGGDGYNLSGAASAFTGGAGGAGVTGSAFTLTSSKTIAGGVGGLGFHETAGAGGAGVVGDGFVFDNNGGGVAGGDGGKGQSGSAGRGGAAVAGSGFTLVNAGYVHGGRGGYGDHAAAGDGGAAVLATGGALATITNNASMRGGAGGIGAYANAGSAGAGITGSNFAVTNNNSLFGGFGGAGYHGNAGDGAAAISGSDFSVVNNGGGIGGGHGGSGYFGDGGAGADAIRGSDITIVNHSQIFGGGGGTGGFYIRGTGYGTGGVGLDGGAGVVASGDSLIASDGYIAGGNGGRSAVHSGSGGTAISVDGVGTQVGNTGTILGGAGALGAVGGTAGAGGAGISATDGASVVNGGSVTAGNGANGGFNGTASGTGGAGGAAIMGSATPGARDFVLQNAGTMQAGKGGYGVAATAGAGGAGISGHGFVASNSGYVYAGNGGQGYNLSGAASSFSGGAGGAGAQGARFVLANSGAVVGGTGGLGFHEAAGAGGAGANGSDFALLNSGVVVGGTGGQGLYGAAGAGGSGASGNGFSLANSGVILGGAGGAGVDSANGAGGVGIVSSGGARIFNAGIVAGGLSGDGTLQADAVDLAGGGNRLVLAAGYAFLGNVISASGGTADGDTLALGGNADASFDLAQLVAVAPTGWTGNVQYYGFNQYAKVGPSTWTITGTSPVAAPWEVQSGGLLVGGSAAEGATSLGGNVTVDASGLLGGFGTLRDNVEVDSGGMLAPGTLGTTGTLHVGGNLTLDAGSQLQFDLVTAHGATTNDHVVVGGTLGFAGSGSTLNLAGQFDPGLYHLFDYAALQTSGCVLGGNSGCVNVGAVPAGTHANDYAVVNDANAQQVNLYAGLDLGMNLWGPHYGSHDPQLGGDGTWTARSRDWVNVTAAGASGPGRMSPNPGFAVFTGTAGRVQVSGWYGRVKTTGMQFAVDGYRLTGDSLTLVGRAGAAPVIRVGDGSAAGAGMTAEIDNDLRGSDGLRKADLGTLILGGFNTFDGGTTISAGAVQVGGSGWGYAALTSGVHMNAGTGLSVLPQANVYGVSGRDGGDGYRNGGNGGDAGAGVDGAGFAMANAGTVVGGDGGAGGNAWSYGGIGGNGGNGGAGVSGSAFSVINTGVIAGGSGGRGGYGGSWWSGGASGQSGAAGVGVVASGDSNIANAGLIMGGFAGYGSVANAVELSGGGNTLTLEASAQFFGNVVSASGARNGGDTLDLGGDRNSWFGNYFDVSAIDATVPRWSFGTQYVGFHNFVKSGASTWMLVGTGDPAVDWTVAAGTLQAGRRALAGNVDVQALGTLDAVPGIGGSLNSAGTVVVRGGDTRVAGNFTQGAGGVLSVSLGSELKVAGSATLAGDLNVLGADRGYVTTKHQDVLTAGTVGGTFAALTTSPGVFLKSTLEYTPTSVWLDTTSLDITAAARAMGVQAGPEFAAAQRLQSSFESLDANLAAGGASMATLEAAGAIQRAPNPAFAQASLQSLSGQLPAASAAMLFDNIDSTTAALAEHLDAARNHPRQVGIWTSSLGWQGSLQGSSSAGTTVQNSGSMVGADFRLGRNALIGYAVSASRGYGRIDAGFDHSQSRTNSVSVYGGWSRGAWYVGGNVATGWYRQDMQRLLLLGQVTAPVAGGFNGSFKLANGEAGMRLHVAGASLTPFVNLRFEQLDQGAFAEQGAGGFGLKAGDHDTGRWQAGLGLRAMQGFRLADGVRMQLDGSAEWRHTLSQYGSAFQASFTGFDDWMPLSSVGLSRNYSVLKLGVGVWPTRSLELHLGFEGQQSQHQHAAATMLEGTLRF